MEGQLANRPGWQGGKRKGAEGKEEVQYRLMGAVGQRGRRGGGMA